MVKDGVKYRKTNEFEKTKMERGERVDMFAHQLEALALKKFGNEGINENKELNEFIFTNVPGK